MKRLLLLFFLIVLLAGGFYVYHLYTAKVPSLTALDAEITVSAADLIASFESNSTMANKKYTGKVLSVNGNIKSIEKQSATVVLGNNNQSTSIRCSMHSGFINKLSALKEGRQLVIKGICAGYIADDSGFGLGADVVLNRCVFEQDIK
jgi:uncharacterized protein (UPF0333 family)